MMRRATQAISSEVPSSAKSAPSAPASLRSWQQVGSVHTDTSVWSDLAAQAPRSSAAPYLSPSFPTTRSAATFSS